MLVRVGDGCEYLGERWSYGEEGVGDTMMLFRSPLRIAAGDATWPLPVWHRSLCHAIACALRRPGQRTAKIWRPACEHKSLRWEGVGSLTGHKGAVMAARPAPLPHIGMWLASRFSLILVSASFRLFLVSSRGGSSSFSLGAHRSTPAC